MIEKYLHEGDGTFGFGKLAGYAWDSRWALRLMCFLLFFDIVMLLNFKHGITQWSNSDKTIFTDIVWIAANFGIFSFLMAIILPLLLNLYYFIISLLLALSGLLKWWLVIALLAPFFIIYLFTHSGSVVHSATAIILYICIAKIIFESRTRGGVPDGHIHLSELYKKAMTGRDGFLLRLYEIKKQGLADDTRNRFNAVLLIATLIITATSNWLVSKHIANAVGLMDSLLALLPFSVRAPKLDIVHIISLDAILLFIIACVLWHLVDPNKSDLIYVPMFDQEPPK